MSMRVFLFEKCRKKCVNNNFAGDYSIENQNKQYTEEDEDANKGAFSITICCRISCCPKHLQLNHIHMVR